MLAAGEIYGNDKEMGYELVEVARESDWRDYHTIRREVLWEARGRTSYNDRNRDEYLPANHPLLLRLHGRAIGTTRLDDFGNGAAPCDWWRLSAIFRGGDTAESWASWLKIMHEA